MRFHRLVNERSRAALGVAALLLAFWKVVAPHDSAAQVSTERAPDGRHHPLHHHRRARREHPRREHPRREHRHREHHHRVHHRRHHAPVAVASVAPAPVERTEGCPAGALRVTGSFCEDSHQDCEQMSDDGRERCLRFRAPSRCGSRRTQPMDFCIDRYEWPNRQGAAPLVIVSWNEAERFCRDAGRRLCTEDEWTLACEGPAMLPYPYGYTRDETACNIDHHRPDVDRDLVSNGDDLERARAEAARVTEATPSGASARCVSPYGVHDMTGNVDEWAVSRTGVPFRSVLKGGWWGRIRARCRPATIRHDEGFRYYQIGFRCCANPAGATGSGAPPSGPAGRRAARSR